MAIRRNRLYPGTAFGPCFGEMTKTTRILLASLGTMALGLVGCVGQGAYDRHVLAGETFTINSPQVVVDSPLVQQARIAGGRADLPDGPWWADRNDSWLNVRRNEPRGETIHYVIHTEDRVQTFGNRTYDVHRQVMYSSRYGKIER